MSEAAAVAVGQADTVEAVTEKLEDVKVSLLKNHRDRYIYKKLVLKIYGGVSVHCNYKILN